MSSFDFLNTKYFTDRIANDKRKKGANTLYNRLRSMARGNKDVKIEEYEWLAFFSEYENNDKSFRAFIKKQLSK